MAGVTGRGASDVSIARVLEAVADAREPMVGFARDLVKIPTENPPGRFLPECAERLALELPELGMEPHLVADGAAPEPRPIVLAGWGEGRRSFYFHGHYDVVPASRAGQFEAVERDGKLHGRGSSDMKSGVAAMIYATHALTRLGAKLHGRIGLVLVPDEETGGAHGSRYLAKAGILGKHGVGMLTAEPTSGAVWNACRGAFTVRLTTQGRHAHVGLQHQGVNAFEHMLPIAQALLGLGRKIRRHETGHRLRPDAARRSILLLGGRVEAGGNFNAVPAQCTLTVDRRTNPEEDFEAERRRLLEHIRRARPRGARLEVEVLQDERSATTPADHSVARALAASAGRAPGARGIGVTHHGASHAEGLDLLPRPMPSPAIGRSEPGGRPGASPGDPPCLSPPRRTSGLFGSASTTPACARDRRCSGRRRP